MCDVSVFWPRSRIDRTVVEQSQKKGGTNTVGPVTSRKNWGPKTSSRFWLWSWNESCHARAGSRYNSFRLLIRFNRSSRSSSNVRWSVRFKNAFLSTSECFDRENLSSSPSRLFSFLCRSQSRRLLTTVVIFCFFLRISSNFDVRRLNILGRREVPNGI